MEEKEYRLDPYLSKIEESREWKEFWNSHGFSEGDKILAEVKYQISIGRVDAASQVLQGNRSQFGMTPEFIYSEALLNYSTGLYQETAGILRSQLSGKIKSEIRERLLTDALLGAGDFSAALSGYSKLIGSEYADADLFLGRAKAFAGLTEYKKSLADIDYYLTLYPGDVASLSLAGSVAAASGDNNGGIVYMNRAIELDPNLRRSYTARGDIWSISGMWENAVSDYSMALDLQPDDGNVYYNKGVALIRLGKTEQACHDLRMALRLGNRKASELINIHCIK
jgi:tetratricopeptide (TPR) repeat protein